MIQPKFNFKIDHRQEDGKHFLKFTPNDHAGEYDPKEIEVTKEQAEELTYHFILVQGVKAQESQLAFL